MLALAAGDRRKPRVNRSRLTGLWVVTAVTPQGGVVTGERETWSEAMAFAGEVVRHWLAVSP